jgi:hypothetical protein
VTALLAWRAPFSCREFNRVNMSRDFPPLR